MQEIFNQVPSSTKCSCCVSWTIDPIKLHRMIFDATLLGSQISTETETDCTRWAMIRSRPDCSCVSLCAWRAVRTGRHSKLISAGTLGLSRGGWAEPSFLLALVSLERRTPTISAITTVSHFKAGTFIFVYFILFFAYSPNAGLPDIWFWHIRWSLVVNSPVSRHRQKL